MQCGHPVTTPLGAPVSCTESALVAAAPWIMHVNCAAHSSGGVTDTAVRHLLPAHRPWLGRSFSVTTATNLESADVVTGDEGYALGTQRWEHFHANVSQNEVTGSRTST